MMGVIMKQRFLCWTFDPE